MSKIIKEATSGIEVIAPNWPLSSKIKAFTTTRKGGISEGDFSGLNLGLSTKDDPRNVIANRELLYQSLNIPKNDFYLTQIHSNICVPIERKWNQVGADASYTEIVNQPSVILTADCLPVLIADKNETIVCGIHAGWRSLLTGIIENSVTSLARKPEDLFVWLGPAISQKAFEIGPEVMTAFQFCNSQLKNISTDIQESNSLFLPSKNEGKYYADIYQLARLRLCNLGIPKSQIYGGEFCTFSDPDRFYSYRRDGQLSGRLASFIWIDNR